MFIIISMLTIFMTIHMISMLIFITIILTTIIVIIISIITFITIVVGTISGDTTVLQQIRWATGVCGNKRPSYIKPYVPLYDRGESFSTGLITRSDPENTLNVYKVFIGFLGIRPRRLYNMSFSMP